MSRRDLTLAVHTAGIGLLAAATAGLGVFGRGAGHVASATSIRGERFDYVTDGIYAYNPLRVVAEGIGWDVVTLFGVAPALLLVSWFCWSPGSSLAARFADEWLPPGCWVMLSTST